SLIKNVIFRISPGFTLLILWLMLNVNPSTLYAQRLEIGRVWITDLNDETKTRLIPGDRGRVHVEFTLEASRPETIFIGGRILGKKRGGGDWRQFLRIFKTTIAPGNHTTRWNFTVNEEARINADTLVTVGTLFEKGNSNFDNTTFDIVATEALSPLPTVVSIPDADNKESGVASPTASLLSLADLAEPRPFYTIQIASFTDLEEAKQHIRDISYIVPFSFRIEKKDRNYVIRAGESKKAADLDPYVDVLNETGYPEAFLREVPRIKENIILEINPSKEKKAQPNLLALTRRAQIGTGKVLLSNVEAKIMEEEEIAAKEGKELTTARPDDKRGYFVGKAWQFYNDEKYARAMEFFIFADTFPGARMEVKLGMAHCYVKQNRPEKALLLFEELVKKAYKVENTLPNLITLLIDSGYYTTAYVYLDELEKGPEKIKLEGLIEELIIRKKFENAIEAGDIVLLSKLVYTYQTEMEKIPFAFYDAAEIFTKNEREEAAIKIYHNLLATSLENWDLRIGIFYALKSILPYFEIEKLVKMEAGRSALPLSYLQELSELRLNVLRERLASIPPSSPLIKELAKEILAIDQDDSSALVALGWWNYNNKQYEAAYKEFSALYQQHPQDMAYVQGLIYSLIELNKFDEALNIVSGFEPENDPEIAGIMLTLYEKIGELKAALSLADSLARTDDKAVQKVAGDFFYEHGWPIKAAQAYSDSDTYYYNADSLSIVTTPYLRVKSGAEGISRLKEFVFPLSFSFPFMWGDEARISLVAKRLLAGDAPLDPFAGKVFRVDQQRDFIASFVGNRAFNDVQRKGLFTSFVGNILGDVQQNNLITSLNVFVPEIELKKEGYTSYSLKLGTTPLDGPIYPLPTFSAQLKQKQWSINIHQLPLEETILSYVGQQDPYGSAEWGRVVRSGIEGEINLNPFPSYWLSLKGGYDYYWGKDVWGNHAFHSSMAFGKTISTAFGDLSPSFVISGQHFQRNTGFFTFGHGGYFSPEFFFIAGPAISFQTKPKKSYRANVQLSAGLMEFQLDSSPRFPFESNLDDRFEKDKFAGLNISMELQGEKLLTPHWSVGGLLSLNNSRDFTDLTVSLAMSYSLEPRSSISRLKYNIAKAAQ
ncbi:MAG: cellulose synthase subunit BcsC-related outer membrane protein, partial [Candidatus Anammoxibacter sp.]